MACSAPSAGLVDSTVLLSNSLNVAWTTSWAVGPVVVCSCGGFSSTTSKFVCGIDVGVSPYPLVGAAVLTSLNLLLLLVVSSVGDVLFSSFYCSIS